MKWWNSLNQLSTGIKIAWQFSPFMNSAKNTNLQWSLGLNFPTWKKVRNEKKTELKNYGLVVRRPISAS